MFRFLIFAVAAAFAMAPDAGADAVITVSGRAEAAGRQSVSFAALRGDSSPAAAEYLRILRNDLALSGWFAPTDAPDAAVKLSGAVRGAGAFGAQVGAAWLAGVRTESWSQTGVPQDKIREAAHAMADAIVARVAGRKPMCSSKIVFVGKSGGRTDIYECSADGNDIRRVTSDGALCLSPNWLPDRRAFYYTSYRLGRPAVFEIDLVTNKRRVFSERPGMNNGAVMSPDGSRTAVVLSMSGAVDMYLIDPASGRLTDRLTRTKRGNEASPSWSPDGRSIVYASDDDGRPRCYVMNLGTRIPRRLVYAPDIGENVSPEWGPDGRIAFCGKTGGRYAIYVIDPAKGSSGNAPVAASPADGADYEDPSWAPDARHIVCTRTVGYRRSLVVLDTDPKGDPPRAIGGINGESYLASWSGNF